MVKSGKGIQEVSLQQVSSLIDLPSIPIVLGWSWTKTTTSRPSGEASLVGNEEKRAWSKGIPTRRRILPLGLQILRQQVHRGKPVIRWHARQRILPCICCGPNYFIYLSKPPWSKVWRTQGHFYLASRSVGFLFFDIPTNYNFCRRASICCLGKGCHRPIWIRWLLLFRPLPSQWVLNTLVSKTAS